MNEQVAQQVISEYAIENANLRLAVATLKSEIEKLKNELELKEKEDEQ